MELLHSFYKLPTQAEERSWIKRRIKGKQWLVGLEFTHFSSIMASEWPLLLFTLSLSAVLCTFILLASPPVFICTFHNLASTCSHLPPDFFPLFNLLSPSLSPSLHPSQQTFSNSLSCKLGLLSSLISKQVRLPHSSLYLPIQPTLILKRACSPCVRNKSRRVHFRVKWDYSAAAFISFCWVFSWCCTLACSLWNQGAFGGMGKILKNTESGVLRLWGNE